MGRIGTGFLVAAALSLAFLSQPAAALEKFNAARRKISKRVV